MRGGGWVQESFMMMSVAVVGYLRSNDQPKGSNP